MHQAISFSARSITSASEEALAIINEKQLKMCSLECIINCDLVRKTTERSNPVRSDCKLYTDYLTTNEARENISEFDRLLPEYTWVSDTKKIDCLLWSKR